MDINFGGGVGMSQPIKLVNYKYVIKVAFNSFLLSPTQYPTNWPAVFHHYDPLYL